MNIEKRTRAISTVLFLCISLLVMFGIYNYMSPSVDTVYEEVKELIDNDKFTEVESHIAERYSNGIFFIGDINENKSAELEEKAVTYMGQVFYKKTGMTINDYMSKYGNTETSQ